MLSPFAQNVGFVVEERRADYIRARGTTTRNHVSWAVGLPTGTRIRFDWTCGSAFWCRAAMDPSLPVDNIEAPVSANTSGSGSVNYVLTGTPKAYLGFLTTSNSTTMTVSNFELILP